jgi:hypothetical protein
VRERIVAVGLLTSARKGLTATPRVACVDDARPNNAATSKNIGRAARAAAGGGL